MAIRKEKIEKQYSRIPMEYLHNKDLTLKEKGMLAVLCSLPESWLFSIEGLARSEADGICLLRSTYKSLVRKGYIRETRVRRVDGRFTGMDLDLFIHSIQVNNSPGENPHVENPPMENPHTVNPPAETRRVVDHRESMNQESNNYRYNPRRPGGRSRSERKVNSFNNFHQREYDYTALEKQLLKAQIPEMDVSGDAPTERKQKDRLSLTKGGEDEPVQEDASGSSGKMGL